MVPRLVTELLEILVMILLILRRDRSRYQKDIMNEGMNGCDAVRNADGDDAAAAM